MTSKIVVNNIESDTGISSVTLISHVAGHNSTQNISGINSVTANTFHGSGANLTSLSAANLTGALPAISGANLTGISVDTTKIETGNTKIETIDTGSDGHIKATTEGSERLRITQTGEVGIGTVTPDSTGGVGGGGLHIHGPQTDNCRITFTTPTKHHPKPAIGFFGLNRFGMDTWDGLEVRDVTASYATRFKIDQNGHITKPNQPGFGASQMNGWTTIAGTTYAVTSYGRVHHNYGNHFNSSNGRFTAPVDGRYLMHAIGMGIQNSYPHIAFGINNSSSGGGPSRGGTNYGIMICGHIPITLVIGFASHMYLI